MKKYYKIIKENMNMRGFKYKVGLNIDHNPIDEQECSNGLHFSDKDNILRFLDYGTLICRVKIPKGEKIYDFECKSKSHSIIIEEPMDLRKVETWEWIIQEGIDIHVNNEYPLRRASVDGHLDVVKYLVDKGANVHANYDYALRLASTNGHLDVVKYLIEEGADIHANYDCALRLASENGYLDVVKYLVDKGADIHIYNDCALQCASANGHLDVIKFLIKEGADVHANDDCALRWASSNGYLDVVKYLTQYIQKDSI